VTLLRACIVCGRPSRERRCPAHRISDRPEDAAARRLRFTILERDGWRCRDPAHPPAQSRAL